MSNTAAEPFERVDAQRARQLIEQGVRVIDVREPREIPMDGKIPDTELVPLQSFLSDPSKYAPDDNVLFYCKVGQRSAIACEMAAAIGRRKLYNLEGGIEAWKKQGLPVVHS